MSDTAMSTAHTHRTAVFRVSFSAFAWINFRHPPVAGLGLRPALTCLMHKQPTVQTLGEAIERWLRLQLSGSADWDQSLLLQTIGVEAPSQRLQALHHVLRRSPELAAREAHVGLREQLRLSLELVGQRHALVGPRAVTPAAQFRCCRAMRRRGRPTRH